jgi:hypothetical protein
VAELALPAQFLKQSMSNGWRRKMLHTVIAAATTFPDALSLPSPVLRLKRLAYALLLIGLFVCMPARGHTAGLDCPEIGPGAVPNLLSDLQVKLATFGNSIDLANEINDLINKLQILMPNISYAELTNVIIATYCPVVANTASLTTAEKWRRIRQFDTILQQQLAANTLAPGTLIVANVPLPPAVYRELRSQAATVGQSPAHLMAAILSRAAGN